VPNFALKISKPANTGLKVLFKNKNQAAPISTRINWTDISLQNLKISQN
jgi:hypothetical protein